MAIVCTRTASVIITQPNEISPMLGTDQTGCDPEYGLDAQLNGGLTRNLGYVTGSASFSITSPTATVSNLADGTNTLLWTVTDGNCYGYDTVRITVRPVSDCDLDLPSGFTRMGWIQWLLCYTRTGEISWKYIHCLQPLGNEVYKKENLTNTDWEDKINPAKISPESLLCCSYN